eukprot:915003-Prorocentrum_minimum.AAC.2
MHATAENEYTGYIQVGLRGGYALTSCWHWHRHDAQYKPRRDASMRTIHMTNGRCDFHEGSGDGDATTWGSSSWGWSSAGPSQDMLGRNSAHDSCVATASPYSLVGLEACGLSSVVSRKEATLEVRRNVSAREGEGSRGGRKSPKAVSVRTSRSAPSQSCTSS